MCKDAKEESEPDCDYDCGVCTKNLIQDCPKKKRVDEESLRDRYRIN